MGFLDRMVADLVGDATGLPIKGLVRRVGATKLLLLGGAAVAGGAVAHSLAQKRDQPQPGSPPPPPPPPGRGHAPPPPPPPPGASDPPPPPPPPPGSPAAQQPPSDAVDQDLPAGLAYAVVRTMVGAALADGKMSPDEKRAIHDSLGESDLSSEQVSQVHQDLLIPPSPDELAAMVAEPDHRPVLYRSAILVTLADHEVSVRERGWLDRLAAALELESATRAELEHDLLG